MNGSAQPVGIFTGLRSRAHLIERGCAGAAKRDAQERWIVTRQDVAALETQPDEKGRIHDAIKIKDPVQFWGASKYLIVIEQ